MKYLLATLLTSSFLLSSDFYYEYDKKIYVHKKIDNKKLRKTDSVKEYLTEDGKTIKFKNEIVVQCKEDQNCLKDIKQLGLNNIAQISKGFYFIKLEKEQNIFEYCQKLFELSSIEVAHPNFIKKRIFR